MVELANTIWRDSKTDGVPTSGANTPDKAKIREWGTYRETVETALGERLTAVEADYVFARKEAVVAATTTNVTLASGFENGDSLDGVTLATGNRILVKNQTAGAENGIYIVAASGAPTRATDADTAAELYNAAIYVAGGTANAATTWQCVTTDITLGTTAIVFAQIADDATYGTGVRADVGTNPHGPGAAPTVFDRIDTLSEVEPSFAARGVKNLFNKDNSAAVWGSYYNSTTGVIGTGSTAYGISGDIPASAYRAYTIELTDDAPSGWTIGTEVHQYNVSDTRVYTADASATTLYLRSTDGRRVTVFTVGAVAYIRFNLANASGDSDGFALAKAATIVTETGQPVRRFAGHTRGPDAKEVRGLPGLLDMFAPRAASANLYDPELAGATWSGTNTNSSPYGGVGSSFSGNTSNSGKMPVTAGVSYCFTLMHARNTKWYMNANLYYWDENGDFLSMVTPGAGFALSEGSTGYSTAVFTPPSGAYFASFNIKLNGETITEAEFEALRHKIMLTEGTARIPFQPYARPDAVTATPALLGKPLTVEVKDGYAYIRDRYSATADKVEKFFLGSDGSYTFNGTAQPYGIRKISNGARAENTAAAFEASADKLLTSTDDSPPIWVNGIALGGNHGYTGLSITATAHGKANVDVGSTWTDTAAKVWILARIVDTNTLVIMPQTGGTSPNWTVSTTLTGSTLTHSAGATNTGSITHSTPVSSQLRPFLQNSVVRLILDGKREVSIAAPGVYAADEVDITHSYGIPNARSVLDALVSSVGSSSDPVYNSPSTQTQVKVETTWKFRHGELMQVAYDYFNVQEYARGQVVGMQAGAIDYGSDNVFLFIPRSSTESVTSNDYSIPVNVTTPPGSSWELDDTEWDDSGDPPERFAQIRKTGGGTPVFGFLMGYSHLVGLGVPATRTASIDKAFQFSTALKMYPWAVNAELSSTAPANEFKSLYGYRGVYDASADTNITSHGVYSWGGKLYWVFDTVSTLTNVWIKPPYGAHEKMMGKKASVTGNGKKSSSLTFSSDFVSSNGVLITTTSGGGWFIAEIG